MKQHVDQARPAVSYDLAIPALVLQNLTIDTPST